MREACQALLGLRARRGFQGGTDTTAGLVKMVRRGLPAPLVHRGDQACPACLAPMDRWGRKATWENLGTRGRQARWVDRVLWAWTVDLAKTGRVDPRGRKGMLERTVATGCRGVRERRVRRDQRDWQAGRACQAPAARTDASGARVHPGHLARRASLDSLGWRVP